MLASGLSGGQGWAQAGDLGLAFLLSALIGLEREVRQRSAGLRTHTLVGVGAALFVLVSKYGFADVLIPGRIALDPSRVAAQVVTGIGFLGAGLIFVRRDAVHGLTTAAVIWVTAAVGMACGAGLPILAILATGMRFIVSLVFTAVDRHLRRARAALSDLELRFVYQSGRDVLDQAVSACAGLGFTVAGIASVSPGERPPAMAFGDDLLERVEPCPAGTRSALLVVEGKGSVTQLIARLNEVDGVLAVHAADPDRGL